MFRVCMSKQLQTLNDGREIIRLFCWVWCGWIIVYSNHPMKIKCLATNSRLFKMKLKILFDLCILICRWIYMVCPKSSCSIFTKILFYKFSDTSMWSPAKYSPLDTVHLSSLFSLLETPLEFLLSPSAAMSFHFNRHHIPQMPPLQHQFVFGEQEKTAGG